MPVLSRLTLLGLVLSLAPGCATVALNAALRAANPQPPWNGEVTVASEPAGAACQVRRGERVLAELAATPATVRLDRSHDVLELRCRAAGHLEAVALLRPEDDPAVFRMAPNGIIGATATLISLATASTMRYPGAVTVALAPEVFASDAARDAWFAARREAVLAARAAPLAAARDRCHAQADGACEPGLEALERAQQEELARLEAQRARTRIAPQVAAAE